ASGVARRDSDQRAFFRVAELHLVLKPAPVVHLDFDAVTAIGVLRPQNAHTHPAIIARLLPVHCKSSLRNFAAGSPSSTNASESLRASHRSAKSLFDRLPSSNCPLSWPDSSPKRLVKPFSA